jgi:hypothetical protein
MRLPVRLALLSPMVAVLILAGAPPARAWERDDLVLRGVLRDVRWLDRHSRIQVPSRPMDDPEPPRLFIDRLPGDMTSAREILATYIEEPQWPGDEPPAGGPLDAWFGGADGWQHGYRHLAGGVIRLGRAPAEAARHRKEALAAFARGELYWGFRHLARSLAYVSEMGEPLRTVPMPLRLLPEVKFRSQRYATLQDNLISAYERAVRLEMQAELKVDRGPLLKAVRTAPRLKFVDVDTATRALALYASGRGEELWGQVLDWAPRRLRDRKAIVRGNAHDLRPGPRTEGWEDLLEHSARSLEVTASTLRAILVLTEWESRPAADED